MPLKPGSRADEPVIFRQDCGRAHAMRALGDSGCLVVEAMAALRGIGACRRRLVESDLDLGGEVVTTDTLSNVLGALCERKIPFGFEARGGETINIWIGERWHRKAQANLSSGDLPGMADWFEERAMALFPQNFPKRAEQKRA
jgi:hypothetical protein